MLHTLYFPSCLMRAHEDRVKKNWGEYLISDLTKTKPSEAIESLVGIVNMSSWSICWIHQSTAYLEIYSMSALARLVLERWPHIPFSHPPSNIGNWLHVWPLLLVFEHWIFVLSVGPTHPHTNTSNYAAWSEALSFQLWRSTYPSSTRQGTACQYTLFTCMVPFQNKLLSWQEVGLRQHSYLVGVGKRLVDVTFTA